MITSTLKVMLWEKEVGRLSWDERRGVACFEFNPGWLDGTIDAFPLVAPLQSPASRRPIMGNKEVSIYHKLPPFLADSLPDAWGSRVFECWRIGKGIRSQEITPLDILSFIGKRGMGALEFQPESSGMRESERLNLEALTVLAGRIFTEREQVTIRPEESLTMQALIAVGTSAGGRQPKAIIAMNPETGEIRSGQIAGLSGFDYFILKFGDAERSSAELEMAYYEMSTMAGIEMMPCQLIRVENGNHFITHRFDRGKEGKLHVQTLAALSPEADSYERLLAVCRKMRLPETTSEEIFRRMVFNILANNTDDHNKNFSFLMDAQGRWRLSPAYDMTYIFNTGGFQPESMHCLMLRGKLSDYTLADVMIFARENGIRRAETIVKEIAAAIRGFRGFAKKHGVQERWIAAVEATLENHLNAWGLNPCVPPIHSFYIGETVVENVRIEQMYKGNYHLYATVGGRECKFVIGKNKPEYALIMSVGSNGLTEHQIREMVRKYMVR
jgi:serine/threonine-protein kinase HipA